ncbi:large ribosomal RNA subunit accumulation protein YCED homolog 1, chloroplastic, partial [Carica papaya]|uniref:large ribosomal RNA subunit accumulation protein YCED homolog 1, chloroplastic n=1 Tax=Carica papaya TaxID=3649 RepID=UPI000B8C9B6D
MSLVCSSSSAVPTSVIAHLKFQREILGPSCFITRYKFPSVTTKNIHSVFHTPFTVLSSVRDYAETGYQPFTEETMSFDWEDLEEIEDADSPWEGAVIYKRNLSVTHIEYCTTLERLGLGKLSTEISKSKASVMGLLVTKAVKDYPNGTPVLVSIDMTRKKQKLRLDGIIRTVITLGCNRCGEPAAECVFSNLSLLLCEEPIEELDII